MGCEDRAKSIVFVVVIIFVVIPVVPVFIIHGTEDSVVPLSANSEALEKIYASKGAASLIKVIKAEGQGHSHWPGFFTNEKLVDFLIQRARGE